MKKFQILFFLFVSISIIISCEDGALFNSGDSIKKDIIINEPFDLIEIENTFDVILIKDTCNFIQVICGANLQKFIKISINQRTLYLNHIVRTNWSRKYKKIILELHLKDMHKINIRKPISLTTKEVFNSDSFYIDDW